MFSAIFCVQYLTVLNVLDEPLFNTISLVVICAFTVATFMIFFEELHFVLRHFEIANRRVKTIWVLAIYPVRPLTRTLYYLFDIFMT